MIKKTINCNSIRDLCTEEDSVNTENSLSNTALSF